MSRYESYESYDKTEKPMEEERVKKELFWLNNREKHETDEEIRQRLEQAEIKRIDFDGMLEKHQERVTEAVETMLEDYPELKGYIGSIRMEDLPEGVYACAGPRMGRDGFYAELQLSEKMFAERSLEWKLVDSEIENFRGERWLAGTGIDGVVKHEMAHLLHLQMISEELGLWPGEKDPEKFAKLEEKYFHNSIAIDICTEARENLGIDHRDVARELSIYGSRDFGEFFAEAISEYETQKHPRKLATEVHRLYKERISESKKGE